MERKRNHLSNATAAKTQVWIIWLLLAFAPVLFAEEAKKGQAAVEAAERPAEFLKVETTGKMGGRLAVALRAEPSTFNPVVAADQASLTVIRRLTADLVHIDRATQETIPALARSRSLSEDGRTFLVELRRGVRFSDGHELDADDVVFTFQAYLDEAVASPNRDLLIVAGEPIQVRKKDRYTVELRLAEPYAVGDRLFDSISILPEHRLREAYESGKFAEAWGTNTAPSEIVGLGPYRLASYQPGERVVLERNPHYWKVDSQGLRLPYLDELVFLIVPDEDAQLLRFQTGSTHLVDGLDAESFAVLQREQARSKYVLEDLGAGLTVHFLFFNRNDLNAEKHPELVRKQKWFAQRAFRLAIDAAIDRASIIRLAYRGRASLIASPVTPGNQRWSNSALKPTTRSLDQARAFLREGGFTWDEQGRLLDSEGMPVRFTLMTNSSSDERVRMASIIEEDLRRLGMAVQVAALEFSAVVERLTSTYEYEACVLGVSGGDVDPNGLMSVLMTGGSAHLWRLSGEKAEGAWQEEIDRLLKQQLITLDPVERKKLYDRVQQISSENLPMIPLVSPNVLVGAHRDLGNFKPAILGHVTLWNAEELYWRSSPN